MGIDFRRRLLQLKSLGAFRSGRTLKIHLDDHLDGVTTTGDDVDSTTRSSSFSSLSLSDDFSDSSLDPIRKATTTTTESFHQRKLEVDSHHQQQQVGDRCGWKQTQATTVTHRRVAFDLDRSRLHENETGMDKEDLRDLWYEPFDYRYFRHSAYALAKRVALVEQKISTSAVDATERSCSCSYQKALEGLYDACQRPQLLNEAQVGDILSDEQYGTLCVNIQYFPARLGLERLSIIAFRADRIIRRRELIHAIKEHQELRNQLHREPQPDDLHQEQNEQETAQDRLRKISEEITLPNRLVAHCMASALAESEVLGRAQKGNVELAQQQVVGDIDSSSHCRRGTI